MIFSSLGAKILKTFSDLLRWFIDEGLGAIYNWLGVAIGDAWAFVWRDTGRSALNDLLQGAFPDLPPQVRQQFSDAFDKTSEPALPLLYFGIAGQIFNLLFSNSTVGYQQGLQQESFARDLNTPINPASAATMERIGYLFEDAYVNHMRRQGYNDEAIEGYRQLAKSYLGIDSYATAWHRGLLSESAVLERAVRLGIDESDARLALSLQRQYLTIPVLSDALFRGIITEEKYYGILGEIGYTKEDADTFRQVMLFYPTPNDLITWISKEVFEPDSQAKYGLADEFDKLDLTMFAKAGVSEEQARNYWIAHWEHPSWTQMLEMLHRNIVTEDEVWEWFRLVEVPPFWRTKMIQAAYVPLTRVDVRRMWDLGVVDDATVVKAYRDQGYSQTDAENLLLFAKVERRMPDIFARYSKGWINAETAYNELIELGLPADKARYLWQTKIVNLGAQLRVATEKDLTKTEIVRGVKKGVLEPPQAIQMLVDIGYDKDEAELVLKIQTDWTGSPETPLEFQQGIELWNKSRGLPYKDIPASLLALERQVIDARNAVSKAESDKTSEQKLTQLRADLVGLEFRFKNAKTGAGL